MRRLPLLCLFTASLLLTIPAHAQDPSSSGKWSGRADLEAALKAEGMDVKLATFTAQLKKLTDMIIKGVPAQLNGPFVPSITQCMFDDPVGQASVALELTDPMLAAAKEESGSALIDALRPGMDVAAADMPDLPTRPAAGSGVDAWLDWFEATAELAKKLRDEAFSKLNDGQMRLFMFTRPLTTLSVIQQTIYIAQIRSVPQNEQIFREILGSISLSNQIDFPKLILAGRLIAGMSDRALLDQLARDMKAARPEASFKADGVTGGVVATRNSKAGRIAIGGTGNNTWQGQFAVAIDLGGDDTWGEGIATVAMPTGSTNVSELHSGIAVAIDLAGNDTWKAEDYTGGGCAQGAALAGVALACDLSGNDTWSGGLCAQGFGAFGVGMQIDHAGNDTYTSQCFSNGVGYFGIGLCHDRAGNDTYTSTVYSTGVGFPGGIGCCFDLAGDDKWNTSGQNAKPQIMSTYGTADCYHGMCMGFGMGFRNVPGDQTQFPIAGGGVGVVLDAAGNDTFSAGEFAMGCGYFYGTGIMRDVAGNDVYRAGRYGIATGAHQACGCLIDDAGDDHYVSTSVAAQAGNWDCVVSTLLDRAGNDVYESSAGLGLGASTITSFAMLADDAGNDTYTATGANTLGDGGHEQDKGRGTTSFAILIDRGHGTDTYKRGGRGPERKDGVRHADEKKKDGTTIGYGLFVDDGKK